MRFEVNGPAFAGEGDEIEIGDPIRRGDLVWFDRVAAHNLVMRLVAGPVVGQCYMIGQDSDADVLRLAAVDPAPTVPEPGVFWCNTNRGRGAGGTSLEQQMRARQFAAAWSGADHPDGMFNYPDHMRRVRRGDLVFLYANGLGVIGVGRVAESRLELLFPDHTDRLRVFASEGQNREEWRIPVEWLAWDEANPCVVESLRSTFQEITDHAERVRAVRQHFRV